MINRLIDRIWMIVNWPIVKIYNNRVNRYISIEEQKVANNRVRLTSIIGNEGSNRKEEQCTDEEKQEYKIRYMFGFSFVWNSVISIYESFCEIPNINQLVVVPPNIASEEEIGFLSSKGYKYCLSDHYDVKEDKPDAFVIYNPHCGNITRFVPEIREYTKLIIVASFELMNYGRKPWIYNRLYRNTFKECQPDYFLFDTFLYNKIKSNFGYKNKLVEMGNSKYDSIWRASKNGNDNNSLNKVKGKKNLLWATTHGICNGRFNEVVTFDLFARYVFDFFSRHEEYGLIFRPHPSFIRELINNGIWTEEEATLFLNYCNESNNIVLDCNVDYSSAVAFSEAMMVDGFCGMVYGAFPLLKPICVLFRSNNSNGEGWLDECLYHASTDYDLARFFNIVFNGMPDYKYEARKKYSSKIAKNFDGNNGRRIRDFIIQRIV